ncbi:MAG: HTTM domain-containing protein [Flavobacteriaceae bacterium]|nr:HTTM domain-containing protein [Flavobacteriaceae bacterium]
MNIYRYLNKKQDSSSLAIFRLGFGFLMLYSVIRIWSKGWIESLYLLPSFHFSYLGFEWVKPIDNYTYLIFLVCAISSFFVAIGYKYRYSVILLFLSFTYIELMDKTTYLNHYYLVSLISFLMIFLPANASYSLDSFIRNKSFKLIPKWNVDALKLMICIVYFYAGIAKINSDWLLEAQPLKIWLTSKYDLPILGNTIFQMDWIHIFFSWSGMFYDLLIAFILLNKKTRPFGFILVVLFHVMTAILFPSIGMFPYIMITCSIIFFEPETHKKILDRTFVIIKNPLNKIKSIKVYNYRNTKVVQTLMIVFFSIQLLFPFRYFLYPGELFWNEQGYRFSWRVMLIEKKGFTELKVVDSKTSESFYVTNDKFLTEFQERQMSFQPDFILEYAHYIGDYYNKNGLNNVQVYAESFVTLNGRLSKRFIDPNVDLMKEKRGFSNKKWITNLEDEIKGF